MQRDKKNYALGKFWNPPPSRVGQNSKTSGKFLSARPLPYLFPPVRMCKLLVALCVIIVQQAEILASQNCTTKLFFYELLDVESILFT
jgi:hypothetical protein